MNSNPEISVGLHPGATHALADVSVMSALDTVAVMRVAIQVHDADDIVAARRYARALGIRVGFSPSDLTIIATALSEIARNIVEYAGTGDVTVSVVDEGARLGLEIVAIDNGPGIADVEAVMRDGYSSGGRLGIGLPGARRLMDEFDIVSTPGEGTRVCMRKFLVK